MRREFAQNSHGTKVILNVLLNEQTHVNRINDRCLRLTSYSQVDGKTTAASYLIKVSRRDECDALFTAITAQKKKASKPCGKKEA